MSGSGSELIVQELEELLECPVCSEVPLYTPIYQCPNGHLVCSTCHGKLQQCPQCRAVMAKIRNLFAEKMLVNHSLQCRFATLGCTARLLLSSANSHQQMCHYRDFSCPVNNCHKLISLRDLEKHLRALHGRKGEISISTSVGRFTSDCTVTPDHFSRISKWTPSLIALGPKVFLAMMMRDKDGLWHFWTFGAGNDDDIAEFSVTIRICGGKTRTAAEHLFRGPLVSIFKPVEETVGQHDGLVLADQSLKKILGDKSKFSFEVIIANKTV